MWLKQNQKILILKKKIHFNKQKASIYLASSSMSSNKSFISIPNALDDIENMIVEATKYKYEKNKEE